MKWRIGLAVLILAAPVIGALGWLLGESPERQRALGWACVGVVVLLLVFLGVTEMVGRSSGNEKRREYGYLEVLIGADGYASTSRAVAWIWTVVFAAALMLMACMTWFSDLSAEAAFWSSWDAYLLLLGGPFASAVLAKGITVSKAAGTGGAPPSTPAAAGAVGTTPPATPAVGNPAHEGPAVADLLKGKGGGTSLSDTQYVLFSLVAIAYFVGALIQNLVQYADDPEATAIGLPPIPAALLGLTSLAAATYVGAKAVETTGIRFVSITPNPSGVATTREAVISVVNAGAAVTEGMITVTFTDAAGVLHTVAPVPGTLTRTGAMTSFTVEVSNLAAGTYSTAVTTPDGTTPPIQLTRE